MLHEIAMQGPGKNALGTAMMTFLLDRLAATGGGPVLLTGAGDAFSAGLDLREVAQLDASSAPAFLGLLEKCLTALYQHPGPTVAAVNGHAIAGGALLTLCCDHRVATTSPRAKIGLNEVPLGLRFPPRLLTIVRERVPRRHLESVVLRGALFAPADALRVGLVDELADDPVATGRQRLEELAKSPAQAYAQTKRDLRGGSAEALGSDAEVDRWLRESVGIWTAPDLKAKIAAVLAR